MESAYYNIWIKAGFLDFEAKKLAYGDGSPDYKSKIIFNSIPARLARKSRIEWINSLKKQGFNGDQIKREILEYYAKGKERSPFEFIRSEYRDKKGIDKDAYHNAAQKRASEKINQFLYKKNK